MNRSRVDESRQTGGLDADAEQNGQVIISSGHMTDAPGRANPRFPAAREQAVKDAIAGQLEKWHVGAGDLAICGGARGSDILFGELCQARGCQVRLLLPLSEDEFLERSVEIPNTKWVERFRALRDAPGVETWIQPDNLGPLPVGANVFARNNEWIIATGRREAEAGRLSALLVWDEKPGDGTGGTSHFYEAVTRLQIPVVVINPGSL